MSAERPPEGAAFAASRVGSPRGRSPAIIGIWLLGFGAVIALGVSGRLGEPGGGGGEPTNRPGPISQATQAIPSQPASELVPSRPVTRPRVSNDDGPVRLDVVRTSASVFVHGDIHADDVVWVFVSLQTDNGRVAGWSSMSFPNAVGTDGRDVPALRFDIEMVVPTDMLADRLWAQANVYDAIGRRVGTTRLELPALPFTPMMAPSGDPTPDGSHVPAVFRGFRPGAHFPLLDASFDDEER